MQALESTQDYCMVRMLDQDPAEEGVPSAVHHLWGFASEASLRLGCKE